MHMSVFCCMDALLIVLLIQPVLIGSLRFDCIDGYYNSNCTTKCGYCLNDEPCDKMTGACRYGCKFHFRDPFCQECDFGYCGINCDINCAYAGQHESYLPGYSISYTEGFSKQALTVIAILSVLLGMSFIAVFIVVFYLKRVVTINTRNRGHTEITQSQDQAGQQVYDNLTSVSGDVHHYISLDSVTREFPQCMSSS